ncbi:hypothetical protein PAPHI01_0057 [Pancytospora philotis]|nr:hypothetical protein PAPHI01_0057 [Pancytospora philotis]
MAGLNVVPRKEEPEPVEPANPGTIKPSHMDMICNPAYHAFMAALEDFHARQTNDIIDSMHLILLIDNSTQHSKIQKLIPQLYPYIERPELYRKLVLLFGDIAHLNKPISDSMLEFNIFEHLDYEDEMAYGLVLGICEGNPDAWVLFREKHLTSSMAGNKHIKFLTELYG